jgi:hypothetical protein
MRQVDVVLSVLTLVAVGLGIAAYRAWHPDVDPTLRASDTTQSRLPEPLALASRREAPVPVPTRCVNGLLMTQSAYGWGYAVHAGKVLRCSGDQMNQVHLATPEEAQRVPSAGPSDS